ncbi:MAG: S8 family peptidase [Desulfobacterota bacterium]|nr:S8 family peptidase [Thermodesulfobacteriota bacterium]
MNHCLGLAEYRSVVFLCVSVLLFAGQVCGADEEEVLDRASREILLQFKPQVGVSARSAVLRSCNVQKVRAAYRHRFFIITVPEKIRLRVLQRLTVHPDVACAEPNSIVRACGVPDDPLYERQWHFAMINLETAWHFSTGAGVVIAVVDTGVNPWGRDGFGVRLLEGYNALLGIPARWHDSNGHGTHVAGTIAQETGNQKGVAGIAYQAQILPVKVLGRVGYGTRASVAEGIYWAVDHGADIINMSLGEPDRSEVLSAAVAYAAAHGGLMVAAAGNDSSAEEVAPVYYPAAFEHVLAVAAVDMVGNRAWYSNAGPEIDIAAPGGDTGVDNNGDGYPDGVLQETFEPMLGFAFGAFGWGYRYLQGTSMAAAHVTGVAALLKALHPAWSPDDVAEALNHTAIDLGTAGKDDATGWGLLNAGAAVTY